MSNSFTYTVYAMDATSISERESEGYVGGNKSTDGLLFVCGKGDNVKPTQKTVPLKPSYVTESMPNWPYLSHTEAKQLISCKATTNGGSDGWFYNNRS